MSKLPAPILISGIIGSGKSTLARHLAKTYGAEYVSASEIHRRIAQEKLHFKKAAEVKKGFWETKEGQKGTQLRLKNLSIDKQVDIELLAALRKNKNTITDARLMPWLFPGKGIRIWLQTSIAEGVRRVAKRDKISTKEARETIVPRLKTDKKIWKKLYCIEFTKDLSPFDLVLNNEKLTAAQTYRIVNQFIQNRIRGAKK